MVLQREQPDADDARGHHDGEHHNRDGAEAEQQAEAAVRGQEREGGQVDAAALLLPKGRRVVGQPVKDEEDEGRQQQQRHGRVAQPAVPPPPPKVEREVLRDGQARRVDVVAPTVAPVEVVPGPVVLRVLPPPVRVGRERQQRAEPTHRVVGGARRQERGMAAIMLDDEGAHGQRRRRQGERRHQPPPAAGQAGVHGGDHRH